MSQDLNLGMPDVRTIRTQVAGLRNEIALAKCKRTAIDTAIKAREHRLARLESQIALAGVPVLSAPAMSAGR